MIVLTISREDLMSGNWQNTKEEQYPSPDDVPILAVVPILVDFIFSPDCPLDFGFNKKKATE